MTNAIGLNAVSSEKLSKELNNLLASYQVFYTNVRGYHWNIKGVSFFELHAKFEEIYKRVTELRKDETLSLLDIEYRIASEFNITHASAVENIALCALADSFDA